MIKSLSSHQIDEPAFFQNRDLNNCAEFLFDIVVRVTVLHILGPNSREVLEGRVLNLGEANISASIAKLWERIKELQGVQVGSFIAYAPNYSKKEKRRQQLEKMQQILTYTLEYNSSRAATLSRRAIANRRRSQYLTPKKPSSDHNMNWGSLPKASCDRSDVNLFFLFTEAKIRQGTVSEEELQAAFKNLLDGQEISSIAPNLGERSRPACILL